MKTFNLTAVAAVVLGLALLGGASPAHAMDLGFQQESMTPARCDQIARLNGKWARVMIQQERWTAERSRYLATVKRCRANGVRVIATLTKWRGETGASPGLTGPQWASFAAVAARELGAYVDAWSPMNEPNHRSFAPAYNPSCRTTRTTTTTRTVFAGWQRVKRGQYQRVRRANGGWRYRPARNGRGDYQKAFRVERITTPYFVQLPAQRCMAIAARQAYDAAAAQIHRYDPSATLIMGDTAGPGSDFMEAWFAANPARPLGSVYALHYSLPNAGVRALAKRYGLSIWVTETALAPSAQHDFSGWLAAHKADGVALTILYGAFAADSWRDLRLTPGAVRTAGAWQS